MDLKGVVDLHLHTGPDVRARSIGDLEAGRAALAHGLAGVLLKNHHAPTAPRAAVVREAVPGAPVYGGVVLNEFVGGLNPAAVHAAAGFGGKAVWLPTFSAMNHRTREKLGEDGIALLDREGKPLPALLEVLAAVAEHDLLLCTGHISPDEVLGAVTAARRAGVARILVQHAEHSVVGLTFDQQRALVDLGAYIERCYSQPGPDGPHVPNLKVNAEAIRVVGTASTVLSSDLGQPDNPAWPEGYASYLDELQTTGFTDAEMDLMCRRNPAYLLGLQQ
jgi:hypothetical protein